MNKVIYLADTSLKELHRIYMMRRIAWALLITLMAVSLYGWWVCYTRFT